MLFLGSTILFTMACALTGGQSSPKAAAPAVNPQETQASAPQTAAPAAPTAAPAAQAVPVMTSDEAIKTAREAMAKLATAGPRHISQTSYKGDTAFSTTEADSVPPNFHQVTSIMGKDMEQYVYDGTLYNKVNGEWSQLPGGAKSFANTLENFATGLSDSLVYADGKVMGIEDINGKPATAYSYTSTLKGLNVKPVQYSVWVDNASGLPVKRVNISPEELKIVQLYTYDSKITITLPDEARNAKTAK